MGNATKTDNHNPKVKLDLRRYFLDKYHRNGEPIHVLDCCQGSGKLWGQLRREYPVASYWGLDQKPKKGRLKIDSQRILAQPGWTQNVIDVDTYGSPWGHWQGIKTHLTRPTTVFLTIGKAVFSAADNHEYRALGLSGLDSLPPSLAASVAKKIGLTYCVTEGCVDIILEAVEAVSDGSASYVGVRLDPQGK